MANSNIFDLVESPVTASDLARMSLTEMVIKEATRLYPTIPVYLRKTAKDVRVKSGLIPKDATIVISVPKIHKDRQQWGENARDFYPERFESENMKQINTYSYVSFSRGRRNCIGSKYAIISIKVVLAHLLRRFKFTTNLKLADIEMEYNSTAFIKNERPFDISPRHDFRN